VQPLILSNRNKALEGISEEDIQLCREILKKIISNTNPISEK
jgi:hypothetical protein